MGEIITSIGDALGGMITSVTQALTNSVTNLIFVQGENGERALSDFASFAFTIFGLSLAVSLVFFVVNWVKGKRK